MDFSKEQQATIDAMINKRVGEIKAKHEKELAEAVVQAEAKAQGEIETLRAGNDTLQKERDGQNERIRKALLQAEVASTGAVNGIQVAKLINENIAIGEDGVLEVVDEKGVVRLDEAGSPLSVKTYLEGFLTDNPHLAKAAPTAGAGTFMRHNAGETKTMRRADFDRLDAPRKTTFVRSGGQLKE
ncbi:MAG TPA: hypothetical protein DDW94_00005 [Deltaproteobacteria bacterium]|nr:MAG: hypothetical protein A2Z79_05370 [Deltaproteobacteria bacterium GWA2_55_82]OGQ63778.1 MAG: hypothetical protein A3I81_09610 [Deltaproteobacteria bacterium RIFCSPLOWO2_02_FULL_55_12]OIJ73371.1 MAG: hypothetical protein A2V21_303290 [Deltaproteobacteria bacterium GWC2_55_46]HBG45353.1 hypothetical protein [Deltaproteobacteria bacterium]HCY10184.1 hypothetical protein [Deltaproteobacteria bacterium]